MKQDYEANATRAIEDGTATKFPMGDGYVVAQRFDHELFILFIKWAPNRLHFRAMLEAVKSLARHEDCNTIAGIGRKGWGRKLAPYGFVDTGDGTLELRLE